MAKTAHQRYAEIMRDVENLINDHSMASLFVTFSANCPQLPMTRMAPNIDPN
jgi:hypothetical protein